MPVNLIRDADIRAISIVDKGANGKKYFLAKSQEKGAWAEGCPELPAGRVLKAEDWSAVYCVVAEPGWHEGPGIGAAEPDTLDRWADEDEIRKAAHRFMSNGGLINKLHQDFEPFGQLVENAVALADFTVNGETITKGSWYIAIAPSDEGKQAIDKGEFTGISIEGMARRELVEKQPAGSTPPDRTVDPVNDGLIRRIAKKLGITDEEVEELAKANRTFGEIVASREFDEALPMAFDAFQSAIWNAFFPGPESDGDPVALITESCDEFKAWTLDKLDSVPVAKAERAEALGVTLDGSTPRIPTFESEDTMTDSETKDRLEKLETTVEKIGAGVEKLIEKSEAEVEAKPPTAEELAKSLSEVTDSVKKLGEDIAKLGDGGTAQPVKDDEPINKEDAEAKAEVFKREGVNPALAGVLG